MCKPKDGLAYQPPAPYNPKAVAGLRRHRSRDEYHASSLPSTRGYATYAARCAAPIVNRVSSRKNFANTPKFFCLYYSFSICCWVEFSTFFPFCLVNSRIIFIFASWFSCRGPHGFLGRSTPGWSRPLRSPLSSEYLWEDVYLRLDLGV